MLGQLVQPSERPPHMATFWNWFTPHVTAEHALQCSRSSADVAHPPLWYCPSPHMTLMAQVVVVVLVVMVAVVVVVVVVAVVVVVSVVVVTVLRVVVTVTVVVVAVVVVVALHVVLRCCFWDMT